MKKIILSLALLAILTAGWALKNVYISQSGAKETVAVTIKPGAGVNQISAQLHDQGVVSSKLIFETYLWAKKYESKIKAGDFMLPGNLSVSKLSEILIYGQPENELTITIPEGTDLRGVAKILIEKGIIENEAQLYAATGVPASSENTSYTALLRNYDFFKTVAKGYSVEGFLFPDTYRVFKDATLEDVLKKMFDNFEIKYEQSIKEEFAMSELSLKELMTLASIVGREGRTEEDKKNIAGILMNRLEIGMALQCDSTVNYFTGKNTGNSSLTDISKDSPYNTYKHPGLPPGPIANPGLEDILAVLNPTESENFYFLNTKDGTVVYAKTFDEHRANREKYGQ